MSTPAEVAQWMADEVRRRRELHQEDCVWQIAKRFGKEHVYENVNGNPAISKAVLSAFRKLTEKDVIWIRSDRFWRLRERHDEPTRRQD